MNNSYKYVMFVSNRSVLSHHRGEVGKGKNRYAKHFLGSSLGSPHPSAAFMFIDEPRRIVLPWQHDFPQSNIIKRNRSPGVMKMRTPGDNLNR